MTLTFSNQLQIVAIGYSTIDKGALTELYEEQLHEDINRVSKANSRPDT